MTSAGEPPIRVFLSYARADDFVLSFIDPFVTSLKHMALADQGRELDIFVDRESIGWGNNWEADIRAALNSATVFMPVVTRLYFDRPACREELLTFYNEAQAIGVASLLLPVVILGHSYISMDSHDVAARIIAERQYRDMKDVWIAGPQSALWRAKTVSLAAELVGAATTAELALSGGSPSAGMAGSADDENAPGAAEVGEALEHFQEESQDALASLAGVLTELQATLANPERLQNLSSADLRVAMLEVAAQLQPLGEQFEERGREFESVTVRTDEIMRAYVRYLREHQMNEILERERAAMVGAESELAPLIEAEESLGTFLENMRPLETSSAPMRRSLRGLREGGKAIRSGITIMRSWPRIIDDD